MEIIEITRDRFQDWKEMRRALYSGIDDAFHDDEMELIFSSSEACCFLGLDQSGEPIAMLEVSLRNFVDGCLGGPVGYLEGIFIDPRHRRQGLGGEIVRFAADWFRSNGCRNMATDAEIGNLDSQRFIESLGLKETYRVVEYAVSLESE